MSLFLVLGDSLVATADNSLFTLGHMKERIADELMRTDLETQIELAISEAIRHHQTKRYYFNETRDITFQTVIGQKEYTYLDNTIIPFLYDVDDLFLEANASNIEPLKRITPSQWEVLRASTGTGQPYQYAYMNKKLLFYPTPNAVWTVRVSGHVKIDGPSDDTTTGNFWMNDAEAMIRHRAKGLLWRDVLYDMEKAAACFAAEADAVETIAAVTNSMNATGQIVPMDF